MVQGFDLETKIPTPKVTGVLGKNIDKYSVISFTHKEIFGDFWTYLNGSSKLYFTSGSALNDDVFRKNVRTNNKVVTSKDDTRTKKANDE